MALLTPDQSKLLTFPGFVERVEDYWLKEGLTKEKAFDEANRDVKLITGSERYRPDQFGNFLAICKQARNREREKRNQDLKKG